MAEFREALSERAKAEGMTLRDYFAAHAPNPPPNWHGGDAGLLDFIES